MSETRRQLQSALRISVALLCLNSFAGAQDLRSPNASQRDDVFSEWRTTLNDAADRTLATALADRSWVKHSDETDYPSRQLADPITRIHAGIARVEQLRPTIEPILRREGIPTELSAIVLVESGGNTLALSKKGARGAWQLMPETARRYGLVVNDIRDDRIDIQRSTSAAARYLKDLYTRFGNWPLAVAAYNAGEALIQGAIDRTASRDFALISNARRIPAETRNYVPAVWAAVERLQGHSILTSNPVRGSAVVYALAEQ